MQKAIRPLWVALGILALGCGIAGVVLPLLPTTPFILLAAYAFARSSPRLHQWLISHRVFGPLIENWERHGAIDKRTKIVAITTMAAMPLLTWVIGAPTWALISQIVILIAVAAFILTRPSGPAEAKKHR
ncbi:MAG: YbaN family protein [Alphaproteobacteria bacterium]